MHLLFSHSRTDRGGTFGIRLSTVSGPLAVGLALLLSPAQVGADNSTSCLDAVEVVFVDGAFTAVETYDRRADEDYFRVTLDEPTLLAAIVRRHPDDSRLRPKILHNSIRRGDCTSSVPNTNILTDGTLEHQLVALLDPGEYVIGASGEGTSGAVGERYRLSLSYSTDLEPSWLDPISFGPDDFETGAPYLGTVSQAPGQIEFAPSEVLGSSRDWDLHLDVAGTGVIVASINEPVSVRTIFWPRLNSSAWNTSIGRNHQPTNAFVADGSLNSDFELRITFRQSTVQTSTRLSLLWIPLCGLRQYPDGASLGCPSTEITDNLPEFEPLELGYGRRLVATFSVPAAGVGPVKVQTHNSDFDPMVHIRALSDGRPLGFDQDDGTDLEALWISSLPPGDYGVEIVDQSGFGSGDTTLEVDQDPLYLDYPPEFPDPPDDQAPSHCFGPNAPVLHPGGIFEAGFETPQDIDAFLVEVPSEEGSIHLWTIGGLIRGELLNPTNTTTPPLITHETMSEPFGIYRSTSGAPPLLCLTVTAQDYTEPRYLVGYDFLPNTPALQQGTAAATAPGQPTTPSCSVPTRAYLDESVRDTADCQTAWRALAGRRRASAKLAAASVLFAAKVDGTTPELIDSTSLMVANDILSLHGLFQGPFELRFLNGTFLLPNLLLNHLEENNQLDQLLLDITGCVSSVLVAVPSFYLTGNPSVLTAGGCVLNLAHTAIASIWATVTISRLIREFEAAQVEAAFLEEYFALGSFAALAARYGVPALEIPDAIAAERGLLNTALFFSEAERAQLLDDIFQEATSFAIEDVDPIVDALMQP